MVRGSGSVGCYQPVKPHTPMECAHKRSGIGGELVAFPCIRPMAVGLPCFRHPTNRLHTRLTTHANHAEGVQYATTSLQFGEWIKFALSSRSMISAVSKCAWISRDHSCPGRISPDCHGLIKL